MCTMIVENYVRKGESVEPVDIYRVELIVSDHGYFDGKPWPLFYLRGYSHDIFNPTVIINCSRDFNEMYSELTKYNAMLRSEEQTGEVSACG